MCDGSARFVDEKIGSAVWARLVTPAGSKIGRITALGSLKVGDLYFESKDGTGGGTQLPLNDGDF
jgi:hypothetical protein